MIAFVGASWRGVEPLWPLFWLGAVLPGLLMLATGVMLPFFVMELSGLWPVAVAGSFAGLYVAYLAWIHVALWRCAFNCGSVLLAYAMRLWVLAAAAAYLSWFVAPLLA